MLTNPLGFFPLWDRTTRVGLDLRLITICFLFQKSHKFNYSIIIGTLAFLICCVFTYAINTFIGLNMSNINLYASSVLVPTILTFNFIIGPLVYNLLAKNKSFY